MNKKLTAVILSVIITILLIIPTVTVTATENEASGSVILGDADGDGKVTIVDATRIQRALASYCVLTEDEAAAADVDGDGKVTIVDATYIQRWLASFSDPFAIGQPIDSSAEPTEASTEASTEAPTESSEVTGDEWKENTGTITLSDSGITVTGNGIYVDGTTVIITEGGDWEVTGSCSNGMIYVYTGDEKDVNDKVKLRLNGMSLTNPDGPAIYFDRCKKAFITLESGSTNTVTDGSSYTSTVEKHTVSGATYSIDACEAKGAIHSDDSLEIKGKGKLTVNGNYKHGINSDDDILIENGVFNLTSVKDGIHANDDITVNGKNVEITINAQADGIESEGTLNLTLLKKLNITAAGKGIKSATDLVIADGSYTLTTTDDSIHSNGNVSIAGGTFAVSSGDDGIHADTTLTIDGGAITITKSYEGLEGNDVVINGGTIKVTSSDDGINAAGGQDQSSQGGRPGQNQFQPGTSSNNAITINDGFIYVIASGDGIDSNGALSFNGGTVIVQGPQVGGNFSVDADGSVGFNGGTVLAICTSNAMWQDITRKIGSAIYNQNAGSVAKDEIICVTDGDGNVLTAVESQLSGSIGILYYNSGTASSDIRFVLGGTYSGTLDSNGCGSGGTVSGGTTVSPSTSSGSGGGNSGPGGRW